LGVFADDLGAAAVAQSLFAVPWRYIGGLGKGGALSVNHPP
jgi:hypothetical protein